MEPHAQRAFLIAATVLLASCAAGTAPPSEPGDAAVLLRLAPAVGSEAVYQYVDTTRVNMQSTMELAGLPEGYATTTATYVRRLTVAEASEDLRLLKIVGELRSFEYIDGTLAPEYIETVGDSLGGNVEAGRIAFVDVLGRSHAGAWTDDGVDLSLESVQNDVPLGGYPLAGFELPRRPVAVGDSWSAEVPLPSEAGPPVDQESSTRYRLDSLRVVNGARHAFIFSEMETVRTHSVDAPNLGAVEVQADQVNSTHLELDLKSGLLVSWSTLLQNTTRYIAGGQNIYTATFRISARTTRLSDGQ